MKYYIICSNPRNGINYLGMLLSSIGIGNTGEEAIKRLSYTENTIEDVLQFVKRDAQNSMWGTVIQFTDLYSVLKVLRHHLKDDESDDLNILNRVFPDVKFIHLVRVNRLRTTVSYVKAYQSGVFTKLKGDFIEGATDLSYDEEHIGINMHQNSNNDSFWCEFFSKCNIQPYYVVYENLCDNTHQCLKGISEYLEYDISDTEIETRLANAILPIKLSDKTNEEWVENYTKANINSSVNKGFLEEWNKVWDKMRLPSGYLGKSKTDKVSSYHNYGNLYDMVILFLFETNQRQPINILEIGTALLDEGSGHAFCNMPQVSKFVGIDIMPLTTPFGEKGEFILGNAYSEKVLENIEAKGLKYHLLIDDGSHKVPDIHFFLEKYANFAASNSIILVEDINEEWHLKCS